MCLTAVRLLNWFVDESYDDRKSLRRCECVADPHGAGLYHERANRQATVAIAIDRAQHVEVTLDTAGLRARRHHAPLDAHVHIEHRLA